jgi:hypothetical protein
MKLICFLILLLPVLGGCGLARQQQAIKEQQQQAQKILIEAQNAIRDCDVMRKQGMLKTYVAHVECSNPYLIKEAEATSFPYMDLINLQATKRLEVAEKVDEKKITEAQGQLELAQMYSYITEEINKRNIEVSNSLTQASIANAAWSQATAMNTQANAAMREALKPNIQQPMHTSTSCRMIGDTLRCDSY